MNDHGSHRTVTLEYPVTCALCQREVPAGEPHDAVGERAKDAGTVYRHCHFRCPETPFEPPKSTFNEPVGATDGEALAMLGATFLVAGASYFLGRWRRKHTRL